jgi:DNA-binding response OmpR family regulator
MKKVLIIDDETENLTLLAEMLSKEFAPITAASGKDGLALAIREVPDVVLLDINMPDMDGFEVCSRLRSQPGTRDIPVIMLTSSSNVDSRVKGLDVGADDYVCKPFHMRELIARVRARVRRHDNDLKAETAVTVGNLTLEPKAQTVTIEGKSVRLTQMEFELLRYFLEHPNQVIPRAKLLGDLWPDSVVTDRTVDTHVANLRKKIKTFNCPLTTIYKAGYILRTE